MNTHLLIDAIVQQTMVFIAQLATAGGVRAPLAHVADQVFNDLTRELQNQGVTKKVIADMFGMALRTYHRRVQETRESRTDVGTTVWAAVLDHIAKHEPISAIDVHRRFVRDDREVVSGVLNDLVNSGLVYRSGRGDRAVYRAAAQADFDAALNGADETVEWLVWFLIYRKGPIGLAELAEQARLREETCQRAVEVLLRKGHVLLDEASDVPRYTSERFEVPPGERQGWEVAVLDHYQAMVGTIGAKLSQLGTVADFADTVGGSTWSLDVHAEHPLRDEALRTLARVRAELENLRDRVDAHNAAHPSEAARERVVFYAGQNVRRD
jgi:predicted transcriptional regulator